MEFCKESWTEAIYDSIGESTGHEDYCEETCKDFPTCIGYMIEEIEPKRCYDATEVSLKNIVPITYKHIKHLYPAKNFDRLIFARCDYDECKHTNECDENSICENFVGSYSCKCKSGFLDVGGMGWINYAYKIYIFNFNKAE